MNLISYLAILMLIINHQLIYEVTHFILPLKLPSSDMLWYVAPTQKLPPFPCEFRCSVNARPFAICECFSRMRPAGRQRSDVERCRGFAYSFWRHVPWMDSVEIIWNQPNVQASTYGYKSHEYTTNSVHGNLNITKKNRYFAASSGTFQRGSIRSLTPRMLRLHNGWV